MLLAQGGPAHASQFEADAESASLSPLPEEFISRDLGWLVFEYHPSDSAQVGRLADIAETTKSELSELLGRPVLKHVRVRVGRTSGEMSILAPRGAGYPKYAAGVAYSELGLVLLSVTARYPGERHELPEIFRHELAHVALHDALGRDRVPRWFNEGFAIHASGEAETSRIQALWTATLADKLIPLEKLTDGFPADGTTASIAYAEAADLVRFLLRGGEEHRFVSLLDRIARGQTFDQALADAYSTDLFTLEQQWRKDVARRYTFWPVLFGGSMVWILAVGLFGWGYVRRKQRNQRKLDQWSREEAADDVRRALAREMLSQTGPVRLVLSEGQAGSSQVVRGGSDDATSLNVQVPANQRRLTPTEVPKVEHDGGWHTLH